MLPFSREQFMAIFVDCSGGVWPAQVLAYLVGLLVVAALWRPSRHSARIVGLGLGTMGL